MLDVYACLTSNGVVKAAMAVAASKTWPGEFDASLLRIVRSFAFFAKLPTEKGNRRNLGCSGRLPI